ncbi:hypothetical protein [Uliginosibacterium sediminicola]|uniref:Uncharacterized protein n=1 Tax=Uliginosibacterium sediminicola TaxID=2024550 RepID=A0ABU9Z1Z0_9RHOO
MLISHDILGPKSFALVMQEAGVAIESEPILSWPLGIKGRSTVQRYTYLSPKSGKTVWVLSYSEPLMPAGEHHEVWQFDHAFSESEAVASLDQHSSLNSRHS